MVFCNVLESHFYCALKGCQNLDVSPVMIWKYILWYIKESRFRQWEFGMIPFPLLSLCMQEESCKGYFLTVDGKSAREGGLCVCVCVYVVYHGRLSLWMALVKSACILETLSWFSELEESGKERLPTLFCAEIPWTRWSMEFLKKCNSWQ